MRAGATGFKVKQCRDTQADNTIASDLAKETRGSTTMGTSRACSNKGS